MPGPVESESRTLIGCVAMILKLPSPANIFRGPEQTRLYNDVVRVGETHAAAGFDAPVVKPAAIDNPLRARRE